MVELAQMLAIEGAWFGLAQLPPAHQIGTYPDIGLALGTTALIQFVSHILLRPATQQALILEGGIPRGRIADGLHRARGCRLLSRFRLWLRGSKEAKLYGILAKKFNQLLLIRGINSSLPVFPMEAQVRIRPPALGQGERYGTRSDLLQEHMNPSLSWHESRQQDPRDSEWEH